MDLTEPGNLGGVTATVAHTHPQGRADVRFLPRVYTVTAAGGAGYTARLTLRYADAELDTSYVCEDRLRLYGWTDAGQWEPYPSIVDPVGNWITATAVNAFSTWAIGGKREPIRIRLWLPVVLRSLPE